MKLMRELRCSLSGLPEAAPTANTWGGPLSPDACLSLAMLRVTVRGPVDDGTGYLCDIKALDSLLERHVVASLQKGLQRRSRIVSALGDALRDGAASMAEACPSLTRLDKLELHLSPYLRLSVCSGDNDMVTLTRSFEFSAAHRLCREDFTDEENRSVFGKCSNPHGHGHNYVLDVTVGGTPDDLHGTLLDPPQFDHIVNQRVIEPFDHRNLNTECAEFAKLNPSVENIARTIWQRLEGAFERCALVSVRVWETPKTYAEYDGQE